MKPGDSDLLRGIGATLAEGAELRGVLLHAGESYGLSDPEALAEAAEGERRAAVQAAETLRAAG